MTGPVWKGNISFGLINIPVSLYSAEKRSTLHFNLLDSRNHAHIRYERINEVTGEEVAWNKIIRAYEFNNDNYVILDEKDFEKAALENHKSVEIEDFIDLESLECVYFEKPYYLVPNKNGEKAYVLLRETLRNTKKVGIAKVLIRTKQYLAAVMPYTNSLLLNLLRFEQEVRKPTEFEIPSNDIKKYKLTVKEITMAERVVESMSTQWEPKKYHDEYREQLMKWIEKKMKKETIEVLEKEEEEPKETAKIIDLMQLLKKSIKGNGKTQDPKAIKNKLSN